MAPFGTWGPGSYAEFRRGSRQIGPTPSISTFFEPFFDLKMYTNCPKSVFRVLYSGFALRGPCFGPKSPISGFCIRGLPHRGHVSAPEVRFPGFVFGVCPLGAMYSPQKSDFRDLYSWFAPPGPCIRPKSSISRICIHGLPQWGPGCASWVRNPKDLKSHLFVTKWDAVAPFGTWGPGSYAEFRRGSRQIGPTPSISTFFGVIF